MLWIQETSRCRKNRSSCSAEFGQAFSMPNGKLSAATPVACGVSSVPLHKCASRSKSCPSLNSDARTQRTPKANPAHGGGAVRDRRPIRFARQLADQASAHRRTNRALSAQRAARDEPREGKAVGEADSFPYRLITNPVSLPLRSKGEAPVLAVAAVTEFDAVPQ
jgi:hypothetical protein